MGLNSRIFQRFQKAWNRRHFLPVKKILAHSEPPDTSRAESDFEKLQSRTPPRKFDYGYEHFDLWNRAIQRVDQILSIPDMCTACKRILEVGCGDATTGLLLQSYGNFIEVMDAEDWRAEQCRRLPFFGGRVEDGLPYPDKSFDFIYSFNTFEHVDEPGACLDELHRVLVPGGRIFLDFGPLFASPWGLHAYRSINVPYPQFLFGLDFIRQKLKAIGHTDLGRDCTDLQPLNKWTIGQFDCLWNSGLWDIELVKRGIDETKLNWVRKYPSSFRGRNLKINDLTTYRIQVLLKRQIADASFVN